MPLVHSNSLKEPETVSIEAKRKLEIPEGADKTEQDKIFLSSELENDLLKSEKDEALLSPEIGNDMWDSDDSSLTKISVIYSQPTTSTEEDGESV